jgi:PAS domain S-box-containing protein
MPKKKKTLAQSLDDSSEPPHLLRGETIDLSYNTPADVMPGQGSDILPLLAQNSLVGFYMIRSGRFAYVNDRLGRLFGYSPDEMVGKRALDFLHPDDRDKITQWYEYGERRETGAPHYESRILCKTGVTRWMEVYETVLEIQGKSHVIGNAIDITERKQAEEVLKESVVRYRRLVEHSPFGIGIASEGRAVYVNPALVRLLHASVSEEILGKPILDFMHPEYREVAAQRMARVVLEKGEAPPAEEKLVCLDGSFCDVEVSAIPFSHEGKPAIHVVFKDITERKRAEETIKASLKEKEVLLGEIHHRVKNNLQIVSSLLRLGAAHSQNEDCLKVLNDTQGRVRAMALVHETLYQSGQLALIGMSQYLRQVVNVAIGTYGTASGRIALNLQVPDISFSIETALPCGLIVNELASNAFKHAFEGGGNRGGEVSLTLRSIDEARFELIVSDNGKGMEKDFDMASAETLGLRLVKTLVNQLDAEMEIDTGRGTEFKIRFRELKPRQ